MCLKCIEKKKLLGRHNKWLFNYFKPQEVFYKKTIVKNLAIKRPLLESLFNSEDCKIFNGTYFEEHMQTAVSKNVFMKLKKFKNCS